MYCPNISESLQNQSEEVQKIISKVFPNFKEMSLEAQYKALAAIINDIQAQVGTTQSFVLNRNEMESGIVARQFMDSLGGIEESVVERFNPISIDSSVIFNPTQTNVIKNNLLKQDGKLVNLTKGLVKFSLGRASNKITISTNSIFDLTGSNLSNAIKKMYSVYQSQFLNPLKDPAKVLSSIKQYVSRVQTVSNIEFDVSGKVGNFTNAKQGILPLVSALMDKEGKLHSNVSAIVTSIVDKELLSSIQQADRSRQHTMAAILGIDIDSKTDVKMPPGLYEDMLGSTVLASTFSANVADTLFNQLFTKEAIKNLDYKTYQRVRAELGAIAVAVAESSGSISIYTMPKKKVEDAKKDLANLNGIDPESLSPVTSNRKIIKYNTKSIKNINKADVDAISYSKDIPELHKALFGFTVDVSKPVLRTPSKSDINKQLSKGSTVSSVIEEGAYNLATTPYSATDRLFPLIEPTNSDLLKVLVGADKAFNPEEYHESEVQSGAAEARYNALQRSLENLYEHVSEFGNQSFYINRSIWQMGRVGESSSTVSPQNDKLHRMFFVPVNNAISYSQELLDKPLLTNPDVTVEMSYLKALGEHLELVKDITPIDTAKVKVMSLINSINYYANTELGLDLKDFDITSMDKEVKGNLFELGSKLYELRTGKKYSKGTDILAEAIFIIESANYLKAKADPEYVFNTSMSTGTDAKTSGYILMSAQSVQTVEEIPDTLAFKQGGVFVSNDSNVPDTFDPNIPDAYQELIFNMYEVLSDMSSVNIYAVDSFDKQVANALDSLGKNKQQEADKTTQLFKALNIDLVSIVKDSIGEEISKVTSEGRDFGKPIFMVTNYGAMLNSIANKITDTVNKAIIEHAKQQEKFANANGLVINFDSWRSVDLIESASERFTYEYLDSTGKIQTITNVNLMPYVAAAGVAVSKQQSKTKQFRNTLQTAVKSGFDLLEVVQKDLLSQYSSKNLTLETVNRIKAQLTKLLPGYAGFDSDQDSKLNYYNVADIESDSIKSVGATIKANGSIYSGSIKEKMFTLSGPKFLPLGTLQMDAVIMMNTINRLKALGIDAVNVHDSIYVAPHLRDIAGKIINEEAYRVMFEYDMAGDLATSLSNLRENIKQLYSDNNLELPKGLGALAKSLDANVSDLVNMGKASIEARKEFAANHTINMLHYVSEVALVTIDSKSNPIADLDINQFGSSLDSKSIMVESLKEVEALVVNAENLSNVYSNFEVNDNVDIDVDTQNTHNKVIELLLKPELEQQYKNADGVKVHEANIDSMNVNAGIADVASKTVYMASSGSPNTYSQSKREVFLHELLHVVYEALVNGNQEAQISLNALFEEAKKQLDYKIFLDKDSKGNIVYSTNNPKEEIAKAKEFFDYVFNNTSSNSKHIGLKEFLSYGLTNPYMIKALNNIKPNTKATSKFKLLEGISAESTLGTLINYMYNLVNDVIAKVKKEPKDSSIHSRLFELVRGTQAVQQKHRLFQLADRGYNSINTFNEKVSRPIKATQKYFEGIVSRSAKVKKEAKAGMSQTDRDIENANLIALAKVAVEQLRTTQELSTEEIQKMVDSIKTVEDAKEVIQKTAILDSEGLIKSIANTVTGIKDEGIRNIHKVFAKSKTAIDRARKNLQAAVKDNIQKSFLAPVSKIEMKALTNLVSTATGYLLNKYSLSEVKDLWVDSNKRANELASLEKVLAKWSPLMIKDYLTQLQGLANYNVLGKGTTNQLTDIEAIIRGSFLTSKERSAKKVKGSYEVPQEILETAKAYVSIYSIGLVDKSNADLINDVWNRENNLSNSNGITTILYTNKNYYEMLASTEGVKRKNNAMVRHGYSAEITDANIEVNIFDKARTKELRKLGYEYVEDFNLGDLSKVFVKPGVNIPQLAVFKRRNNGSQVRQSGAISMQNNYVKEGISIVDLYVKLYGEYPSPDVRAKLRLDAHNIRQRSKNDFSVSQSNSSYDEIYLPVMSKFNKLKVLNQVTSVDDVLGQIYADTVAIQNSLQQNKEVMSVLEDDYAKHGKNNPDDFVWINDQEVDKYGFTNSYAKDYQQLPKWMKDRAKSLYGDRGLPIRKNHVRIVLGGHKYSVANSHMVAVLQKWLPSMPVKTVLANAELLWQEIVSTEKVNIVIKTPATWTANIISNVLLANARGIPPHVFFADAFEAIKRLREYENAEKKVNALKAKGTLTKSEKADLNRLEDQMRSSTIHPMINRGLYQTVAEDVDTSKFGILDNLGEKAEVKLQSIIGVKPTKVVTDVTSQLFLTQNSTVFKVMNKINTYGDFVGRYSLIKHELALNAKRKPSEKITNDEIYQDAVDSFINYDLPDHMYLQYANDMGLVMFTKFFLGIQHVIAKLVRDKPVTTAGMLLAQHVATELPDIIDESILFKALDRYFHLDPLKHIEKAVTPSGWSIIDDMLSIVNIFK